MSGQLAAAEPYATRFETEVTAVDGRRVWLETSHFYAESGGQPADSGRIGDTPVADVQLEDGEHVHVLAEDPTVRPGHRVLCRVDWASRMYCMRAHTASHVLYGAGRRLLDDLTYAGFDIGESNVRVDLETPTPIDDDVLVDLERLVNRAIWESRPVSWEAIPVAHARERDEIAFNEATEDEAVSRGEVRVVTIGDTTDDGRTASGSSNPWDVAACGGTHVRNTREIGPVTVLDRSNPGEGLTGVEFAVGPRAIERRAAEKRATYAAKRTLTTDIESIPDTLGATLEREATLEAELDRLQQNLVTRALEDASGFDRGDVTWLVSSLERIPADLDTDVVGEVLRDYTDRCADADAGADVVAVVGSSSAPFVVVATTEGVEADSIVAALTAEFGGGGGGSSSFAQGGGFDVSATRIVEALESPELTLGGQ